jgi:hypothetical protein
VCAAGRGHTRRGWPGRSRTLPACVHRSFGCSRSAASRTSARAGTPSISLEGLRARPTSRQAQYPGADIGLHSSDDRYQLGAFRGPQCEQVADGDLHRVAGIRPAASILQELMRTQRIWRLLRPTGPLLTRESCHTGTRSARRPKKRPLAGDRDPPAAGLRILRARGVRSARARCGRRARVAWLYRRYRGCGFWAAIDRQPGNSWDSFISGRVTVPLPARPNSVTGCARQPGAKGTPLRGRALIGKGFTQYGVQRVVAEAMAVNQASRRVIGKAALTMVRTFLQPWPYPVDGDQSASWSMRWTRPDGSSRTSPAVAQPDRRAPGEAQVRDGAYAGQLACAGAGLAGSVTSPSARPPRVSRQARELACLSRVGPRGDGR